MAVRVPFWLRGVPAAEGVEANPFLAALRADLSRSRGHWIFGTARGAKAVLKITADLVAILLMIAIVLHVERGKVIAGLMGALLVHLVRLLVGPAPGGEWTPLWREGRWRQLLERREELPPLEPYDVGRAALTFSAGIFLAARFLVSFVLACATLGVWAHGPLPHAPGAIVTAGRVLLAGALARAVFHESSFGLHLTCARSIWPGQPPEAPPVGLSRRQALASAAIMTTFSGVVWHGFAEMLHAFAPGDLDFAIASMPAVWDDAVAARLRHPSLAAVIAAAPYLLLAALTWKATDIRRERLPAALARLDEASARCFAWLTGRAA